MEIVLARENGEEITRFKDAEELARKFVEVCVIAEDESESMRAKLATLTAERDAFKKRCNDLLGCETRPGLPDLAGSEEVADMAFKAVFVDIPEIANKPSLREQIATLTKERDVSRQQVQKLKDVLELIAGKRERRMGELAWNAERAKQVLSELAGENHGN